MARALFISFFFFFNDTATTEIYTLSLHDALPICARRGSYLRSVQAAWPRGRGIESAARLPREIPFARRAERRLSGDRKSTRLNSSHANISYAVFCLKKKKIE